MLGDGWRCWLRMRRSTDMPADRHRGPSIDSMTTSKSKGHGIVVRQRSARSSPRMQHQRRGPTVPWPNVFFVADPAPIITSTEWLARKRGSEARVDARPKPSAVAAAEWLVDRLSRLAPSLHVESRSRPVAFLVVPTVRRFRISHGQPRPVEPQGPVGDGPARGSNPLGVAGPNLLRRNGQVCNSGRGRSRMGGS